MKEFLYPGIYAMSNDAFKGRCIERWSAVSFFFFFQLEKNLFYLRSIKDRIQEQNTKILRKIVVLGISNRLILG